MTELASSSTRIELAGKRSPEDEQRLRQIMQRLAHDLSEKAQLLRSIYSEANAAGVFNHPVLFCAQCSIPYALPVLSLSKDALCFIVHEKERPPVQALSLQ